MKHYISLIVVFLFLTSTKCLYTQEYLTLHKAIALSLNRNSQVIKSINNLETSSASIKNAYGKFLPSLNVSGGWNWQRISSNQGTSQIDYLGNTQNVEPSESDNRSFNLSVGGNITLFDGLSNTSSLYQKKNSYKSGIFDLEKLQEDVILQTVAHYLNVINCSRVLTFQENDLKYNQNLLLKIQEMFNLQMIAKADLYAQEYQTANSQLLFIQAKSDLEIAKINLLNYLSLDLTAEYDFELETQPLMTIFDETNSVSDLYKLAFENRSDYKSQLLKLENCNYQHTIAKSGFYPTLSGSYGLSTSAVQLKDMFNRKVYNVGLSLSIPIFSQWNTEYSIQSANVDIKNTNEELKTLERQIISDVKTSEIEMKTAKAKLEVSATAIKAAKETWEIIQEKFALGLTTFIELRQSYRDYVQAVNNEITATSNFVLKQFEMRNAIGTLIADQ